MPIQQLTRLVPCVPVVPVLLLLLAMPACQTRPPADVTSDLQISPLLNEVNPTDIAVMPIEDATADHALEPHGAAFRYQLACAIARRLYTPMAISKVDELLAGSGEVVSTASVADAAYLGRVAGRFQEDALLGVRVLEWNERAIMDSGRLKVSAEVALVESKDRKILWSGSLTADVKAGGSGPAPIGRAARIESAIALLADAMMRELPSRRP